MWIVCTMGKWILTVLSVVHYILTQSPSTDAIVINAEILLGSHRDKRVLIPQLVLESSDTDLPFVFRHRQFSLHLAWAMTINKFDIGSIVLAGIRQQGSTGQSFGRANIYSARNGSE